MGTRAATASDGRRRRPLARHAGIPLYLQIRDDIAERIERGELLHGDRLESESELTSAYDVGRPTVRQAIDLLRRSGLVTTVRGSGTFVVGDTANRISLLHFDGLTPSLRARGIEPSDEVVGASAGPPPLQVLTIDESPGGWWVVERVRSLPSHDGTRPFCVESDAFNLHYCPDAAEMFAASGSASAVLDEGYRFAIAQCDVATRAEKASAVGVHTKLRVAPSFPVLVMERINWTSAAEPVHAVRYVIATDRIPVVERLVNPLLHA